MSEPMLTVAHYDTLPVVTDGTLSLSIDLHTARCFPLGAYSQCLPLGADRSGLFGNRITH